MKQLGIKYISVDELAPYAMNARVHSEEQIQDLARSIQEFGFVNPVLLGDDGVIIAGHGRVEAAKVAGLTKVPCIVLSHLNEKQRRALTLADNRITLKSSWDFEKVSAELSKLAEMDYDLSVTGFTDDELDSFLRMDAGIMPDYEAAPLAPRQTNEEPQAEEQEPREEKPKASDDEYSKFELIMLHDNKLELVEIINELRKARGYAKLEDALMEIAREWRNEIFHAS
jgi:hypothetical protein